MKSVVIDVRDDELSVSKLSVLSKLLQSATGKTKKDRSSQAIEASLGLNTYSDGV